MGIVNTIIIFCSTSFFLFWVYVEQFYGWNVVRDSALNTIYSTNQQKPNTTCESVQEVQSINQFLANFGELDKNQYDYEDIVYPIPFKTLYNDMTTHYVSFNQQIQPFPSYILTGKLPNSKAFQSNTLFITGASANHGVCSFNCMYSMLLADPYASFLYVDFGLSSIQIKYLVAHLSTIHQIQKNMGSKGFLAYRKFNWRSFPKWMSINNEADRGGYSWKFVSIRDAFYDWKGMTVWMDGGNLITDGITRELAAARTEGVYSPCSSGNVNEWVHPKMQEFLLEHHFVERIDKMQGMGMGGVLFLDYSKPVSHKLLVMVSECIYTKKCVSPEGTSRKNHRQDQAILSVILHELRIVRSANRFTNYHPSLRNEVGNDFERTRPITENLFLLIQQTYHVTFENEYYNTRNLTYQPYTYRYNTRKIACVCLFKRLV